MKTFKYALVIALALASGATLAEQGEGPLVLPHLASSNTAGQESFGRLDLDGDGHISREEAQAGTLPEIFLFMDRNHDGRISRQEFHHRPR
ncbi:EF-hand domain-containing protein [Halomonas sp. LR3S48]|uniref:EF-hand domain-containing protein n=1 Tax=Halomonas sp. LR3S48 TaxID=2982694 RepID=UPI0021E4C01F|nr:EF-hand domain-containing protein [Halomonas sp. LR3S48]UYG02995.1 EF-hand domain-containing protein [Halomonas sp. LR3S48]